MRNSTRLLLVRSTTAFAIATAALACAKADAAPVLPAAVIGAELQTAATADTAIFAGGCFWGVEAVFRHVRGVSSAVSGYAGGTVAGPSYEQVSNGTTGHAEAVQVIYDPRVVSYGTLLRVFFSVAHDPTELNRQGPDVGTQYRSAIFTRNKAQAAAVTAYIGQLAAAGTFREPIVTQVAPLTKFWKAESYHQNYLASHRTEPYIVYNDLPKLDALKRQFADLYREDGIASK
ncbi:MAG: peptide-methionine (S)-S-oxide reductase MsrA [Gemmatimonadota bacterium]